MILGIDTSGKNLGLAVGCKEEIIASSLTRPGLRHGEILQERIDSFLTGEDISIRDLKGLSVTLGPGSFTGLRIGLAAVKGYSYALNIPLAGISTLHAGAGAYKNTAEKVAVIIDARRDEIYYAMFDCSKSTPQRLTPDNIGPVADLCKSIDGNTILFGPAHLSEHFVAQTGQSDYHISDNFNLAETAALIGEKKIAGNECLETATAVPVYLRCGF
jgi:tRNA threonylcarbamoyladenosine biosynthesis protein TsaB